MRSETQGYLTQSEAVTIVELYKSKVSFRQSHSLTYPPLHQVGHHQRTVTMHNLQLQSPFFTRLPPEIRLRIYDHYGLQLTFDSTAFLYSYYNEKVVPKKLFRRLPPALLRTCKRAYAEARSSIFDGAVLHLCPFDRNYRPTYFHRPFGHYRTLLPGGGSGLFGVLCPSPLSFRIRGDT